MILTKKVWRTSARYLCLSILFFGSLGIVYATHDRTRPVQLFFDGSKIEGAWSIVSTNDDGATMNLHTEQLLANHIVTVWWIIFNHPEKCSHGEAPFRCGQPDLSVAAVDASVVYASGDKVKWDGTYNADAVIKKNDVAGALFGHGLTNPTGADIHLVVRDHGKMLQKLTHEQSSTFGGGCSNTPPGTGVPGPNTCVDLQFSVHEQ